MDEYNALWHYAKMRRECVADLPTDIDLHDMDENERDLIIKGIPLVYEAILSIYNSVAEYAQTHYLTPKKYQLLNEKGGKMRCNNESQVYLDTIFHMLLTIAKEGELIGNEFTLSKNYLKNLMWENRCKLRYKHTLTLHFQYFCNIACYQNDKVADYRNCDTVIFKFTDTELVYTLRHMAYNGVNPFYFQYGDFRMFSVSGKLEDSKKFPQSVRKKVVGEHNYKYYPVLKELFYIYFSAEPSGENPYQGYGNFSLIEEYNTGLENTSTSITAHKNKLILRLRMGFDAFNQLPDIISDLSNSIQQGIFSTPQCVDCPLHCNSKRKAEFDVTIYPSKISAPCKCTVSECIIACDNDIKSVELLFKHMLKFSKFIKKKNIELN